MDTSKFINDWIAAGNCYNTNAYLNFFQANAVLDDPSVGRKFIGHEGIRDYFVSYFIGYQTQTALTKLEINRDTHAYLEVAFTGNFPEGHIGGSFEIIFKNNKIGFVKAKLIH
jgi:hypothetical protein